MTPTLSLNLGLRYDIMRPYTEVHNRWSFMNPDLPNPAVGGYPGAVQFAGDGQNSCHCRTPIATYYGNVGPRLGAAYSLDSRTVLRGGYGNYTFSRTEDNLMARTGYDFDRDWAVGVNDQPHVVNIIAVYDMPFGGEGQPGSRNDIVRSIVSGWQVSGITQFRSGRPLGTKIRRARRDFFYSAV